jgi:hypothetical protein
VASHPPVSARSTPRHREIPAAENGHGGSRLTERGNRYLARRLCWVLTIGGLDTYVLVARDPLDLDLLVEAIRPDPGPLDVDLVIGERGPIAPAEVCGGLMLPMVAVRHMYSFTRDALVDSIPRPEGLSKGDEQAFRATAGETLEKVVQLADNAGATDEHRAANYVTVRHPAVHAKTAEMNARDYSLAAVDFRPSRLSGSRRIVDVVFTYQSRQTGATEPYFVRVDVTEEFPFLAAPLQPYFNR